MRHVFISYCREDVEFAKTLETQLELAGLRVWRDAGLRAGEDWRAEIDRGLREALAVVVILSPDSARSAYVNYEWAFALGSEVPVIPVRYKEADGWAVPQLEERDPVSLIRSEPKRWRELFQRLEAAESALIPTGRLVSRNAPPAIQAAAQLLNSMDAAERNAAFDSLADTTHPEVVEVLAEAARHPIRRVRHMAAVELANRQDPRGVPALLEALRGRPPEYPIVRDYMLSHAGAAGVPALAAAVATESNEDLRRAIYEALGTIGTAPALEALRGHLEDSRSNDRYFAASALAQSGDERALPVLVEGAQVSESPIRQRSLYGLSNYLDRFKDQVAPLFAAALQDQEDSVLRAGVSGLEKTHDPAVIPLLLQSFFHARYDFMNSPARHALTPFGPSPSPYLRSALSDPDADIRYRAACLLKTLRDPADADLFRQALEDSDRRVRLEAISALEGEHASAATPALIDLLDDDDGAIVSAAVWSLGKIRDARAVPALLDLLQTGYGEILRRAVIALGNIGSASAAAVPVLIDLLKDKDLADWADSALRNIGTREAKTASRLWQKRKAT